VFVQTDAIQAELERILSSDEFSSSPRLVRFLRYCVEQSSAGQLDRLKESVIGVTVFDRVPGYDPKIDPIVRVHARRLREKLDSFYSSEDAAEIVIQIPKGGYVAHFREATPRCPSIQAFEPSDVLVIAGTEPKRPRMTTSVTVALCALVLVALGWIATRREFTPSRVQPLVNLPGSANDPAWAPDGKTIAFTWDGDRSQTPQVYVLKKDESVPARLTEAAQPEYRPVWSPDGHYVALLREIQAHNFAIVIVNAANRAARVVRTILQLSPASVPPALDWSADGGWLVSSEQPSEGAEPVHLLLISPQDGKSWVITDPPNGSTGDLEARFSPDSKRILFRRGGHGDLFMLALNGTAAQPPTQVTLHNAGVRGLTWSHDGKTIYFGSQKAHGQFGIWRMREGDAAPAMITPDGAVAVAPAIDPLGRSLAFAQPAIDVNLWMFDARRPAEPRLLVPSTQAEYSPAFSPDGKTLAFISDRSGTAQIWISGLNGGQPRKVTSLQDGDLPMSPAWSPDGTKIAYFCRRNGLNYAYQTNVATGDTLALRSGEEYALFPQYSKDGTALYYVSNAGNRFRIWRESLNQSGPAEPTAAEEVRFFRLSKDRQFLYFIRFQHSQQLVQLNLSSKEEQILWTFPDASGSYDTWDVAGNRFFYISFDPVRSLSQLVVVDLIKGELRVLGGVRRLSGEWQTSIAASPDGESAIVAQVDSDRTRLMVMRIE
jgi:Tol biopolymer transport system component